MKPINPLPFLICFFLCSYGQAQTPVSINSGERITIGKSVEYLIDSARTLTINEVLRKPFQRGQTEVLNFGMTPNEIWLRFSVASQNQKELYLEIAAPLLDTLQLYEVANGVPKQLFEGGIGKPFSARPILSENWLFSLDLSDGATHTYYLKVRSVFPLQMPIALSAKDKYAEYDEQYHLFWGLYIGVILFAFIYNFFIYLVVREKRYLYYILYILFSLLFYLGLQGYNFQFLWPDYPYLNYLLPVTICITNILIPLFTMDFLNITRRQKFDYYGSLSIIVFFSIVALINLAGGVSLAIGLAQLFSLVICVFLIIAGIRSFRRQVPGARYFLIAWTVFLVFVIMFILTANNVLPSNFFTSNGIFIGHMTEVGLLSFALASRINWLKSENEKKQKEIIHQLLVNKEIQVEANRVLEQKVVERTAELRASQALLIQKEKLASLGELTAGIAHEIQNPLNFVNNFSELSVELVDELNAEIEAGSFDEVKELAGSLQQNLQKISHHGKRAASIVSGMLEHTRNTTGEIQLTNINTLANQYLQMAYQGQVAKEKAFKAQLRTEFDTQVPDIQVAPQEIGRVLMNLYKNALYAVGQRAKNTQADGAYEPTIWVTTHNGAGQVHIHVRDNGTGIADTIKPKIFQPFFTTKPTGEGTGMGLSLSYDIITKGYGGEMNVLSGDEGGAEFVVKLPIR